MVCLMVNMTSVKHASSFCWCGFFIKTFEIKLSPASFWWKSTNMYFTEVVQKITTYWKKKYCNFVFYFCSVSMGELHSDAWHAVLDNYISQNSCRKKSCCVFVNRKSHWEIANFPTNWIFAACIRYAILISYSQQYRNYLDLMFENIVQHRHIYPHIHTYTPIQISWINKWVFCINSTTPMLYWT